MTLLQQRLAALVALGKYIEQEPKELELAILQSYKANQWFTPENTRLALENISQQFLQQEKLEQFIAHYKLGEKTAIPKTVGFVLSDQTPAEGFQDIIYSFLVGHKSLIKLSPKDAFLIPAFIKFLATQGYEEHFEIVKKLKGYDAVLVSSTKEKVKLFETYFKKCPNLIRTNRNSVAVLRGDESDTALKQLGVDVFRYFGLSSRNVSKIYIPQNYNFVPLQEAMHTYNDIIHHNQYKNNFDYNFTLLILNKIPHKATGSLLFYEREELASRVACIHFEYYDKEEDLKNKLQPQLENIEVIAAEIKLPPFKIIPFGQTQTPTLFDFKNGMDVMTFLLGL